MRHARYLALLLVLPVGLLLGHLDPLNMVEAEEEIRSDQSIPVLPVASEGPCTFDITLEVIALHDVLGTVTVSCPDPIEETGIELKKNGDFCDYEYNENSNYAKADCGNEHGTDEYCAFGLVFYEGGFDQDQLCDDF